MNILFVSRAYGKNAGGMERLSFELIQAVAQANPDQTTKIVHTVEQHRSLTWTRLTSAIFSLTIIPQAIWRARAADIVHISDPVLSFAGWLIQKLTATPVAVTIHGLDVSYTHPLYRFYLSLFFRNFSQYICISRHAEKKLKPWNVAGSVTVIPPGINSEKAASILKPAENKSHSEREGSFRKTAQAPRARFSAKPFGEGGESGAEEQAKSRSLGGTSGLEKRTSRELQENGISSHSTSKSSYSTNTSEVRLLTVGRLVKRKGHAWFIRNVLPHLPDHTQYIIAGSGPEQSNIEQAIQETGQHNQVQLLGRVSNERIQELYISVNIFVQPNIPVPGDAEGFGIVLLEAALHGNQVVASNIDGIPDAIHHGKNGILLPPQNTKAWITTLTELINNPPATDQAARQYTLSHFSWSTIAERYLDALKHHTKKNKR